METVLITGGTGLVGEALAEELTGNGYDVIILTRNKSKKSTTKKILYANWNVKEGTIDKEAIQKADHIIHLAGANVAEKRWTKKRKIELEESRTKSGALIVRALKEIPNKVQTVISASGIGWYGADPVIPNHKPFKEEDPADDEFLGAVCKQWEAAIMPVEELGKRLLIFRMGIVLSNRGGAYAEFLKSFKFRVAAVLGNGKQIYSWVHIKDLVKIYLYGLENKQLQGIYNVVTPNPVSNKKLMKTIGEVLDKKYITVPVPDFALKIVLGEMSVEVLKSATVSSKKIEEAGYSFSYPSIESAVEDLVTNEP